jgi:hypothetical protein
MKNGIAGMPPWVGGIAPILFDRLVWAGNVQPDTGFMLA